MNFSIPKKTIFLSFFIFSFYQSSFSQSCGVGCSRTVNVSGTNNSNPTVNDNDVICVTGNGTYNGNIDATKNNVTICIDETSGLRPTTLTTTLAQPSTTMER